MRFLGNRVKQDTSTSRSPVSYPYLTPNFKCDSRAYTCSTSNCAYSDESDPSCIADPSKLINKRITNYNTYCSFLGNNEFACNSVSQDSDQTGGAGCKWKDSKCSWNYEQMETVCKSLNDANACNNTLPCSWSLGDLSCSGTLASCSNNCKRYGVVPCKMDGPPYSFTCSEDVDSGVGVFTLNECKNEKHFGPYKETCPPPPPPPSPPTPACCSLDV